MVNDLLKKKDVIRWQGITTLANLTAQTSQAHIEGQELDEIEEQCDSIIELLEALDQAPFLTDEEVENLLYCLLEVADIRSILPMAPTILPQDEPSIESGKTGNTGPVGPTGPPGSANVSVSSDPAFNNMSVVPVIDGDNVDYQIGYDPYVAPDPGLTIDNGIVKEVGALYTTNFTASYVLGKDPVTVTTITSPITPTWTTNPQSFAHSGQVHTSPTVITYTAHVEDGTSTVEESKTVTVLYPLFYGNADAVLTGAQIYSNLTKLVQDIPSVWEIPFDFDDDYAIFAFDENYDDSNIIIKDQNGFVVNDDWQVDVVLVDSGSFHAGSGGTDWTKNYKVYRTKLKTDIHGTFTVHNVTS